MYKMRKFIHYAKIYVFFIFMNLIASTPPEIQNPFIVEQNKQDPRSTFLNFESKKLAIKGDPGKSKFFASDLAK